MLEINDIVALIENAGLGTLGTDLFKYSAPAEVAECIILYPSNDPPIIDPERPFFLKGRFQTIIRCKTHDYGIEKSKELLTGLTKFNVEGALSKIKEVRPLHQPRVYRRADSGSLEFSITYQVTYVQK